jgi:ubiquinol-cytochrome c reductase cytochrome b subunit
MLSAIPWIGQDFVQFVWGGFSVNNATLNRFFSLHFLLPFVLAALAVMHMMALHTHGSSNPLGISSNADKLPMHPYFVFKDLVTILAFFLALSIIVFYLPNAMGHSDNYIPANPMQTPPSIVPEWYLLPYYAILRSIPNKLLGVVAMLGSLLILLLMPILDTSRVRGSQFRPLMRFAFWVFVTDFFLLMFIGSQHAEEPYITIGAIATALYFSWFLVIVPVVGVIENTLMDIATDK